jgi:hypothetical protein
MSMNFTWSRLQPATRTLVLASARVLKHPLQAKACSTRRLRHQAKETSKENF